jgi:hypothetical protein
MACFAHLLSASNLSIHLVSFGVIAHTEYVTYVGKTATAPMYRKPPATNGITCVPKNKPYVRTAASCPTHNYNRNRINSEHEDIVREQKGRYTARKKTQGRMQRLYREKDGEKNKIINGINCRETGSPTQISAAWCLIDH